MMSEIKESDWKVFRRLRGIALERFCRRVIEDVNRATLNCNGDYHKRYLEIYKLITDRDKQIAVAFNDVRRSTATIMLTNIKELDLLTDEEFSQFSPETREKLEVLIERRR